MGVVTLSEHAQQACENGLDKQTNTGVFHWLPDGMSDVCVHEGTALISSVAVSENVGQDRDSWGSRARKTLSLPPQGRTDRVQGQVQEFKEPGLPRVLAEEFTSLSLPLSISAEGGGIWRTR